jgi:hypothetical protein
MARYSKKAKTKIAKTMREYKKGKLRSGSKRGPKVKSRRQAVAIAINQARRKGYKTPKRRKGRKKG